MSKKIGIKRKDAVTKGKKVSGNKGDSKKKTTVVGRSVTISKKATGYEILNNLKINKAIQKAGRSAVSKSKKKAR
jgi:hypothetical protein